ncbi:MAG: ferric reductase-like transmembrane domain-containing protein [Spirochaetia bacterium]
MIKSTGYIWLAIYIASPFLFFLPILFFSPELTSTIIGLLGTLLGVISFTWFCWQVVLSARPKFIERTMGLDTMYTIHVYMPPICIAFGIIHGIFFTGFNILLEWPYLLGGIALLLFIITGFFAVIILANTPVQKAKIVQNLRSFFKSHFGLEFERTRLIHNSTMLILTILFIHVISVPQIRDSAALTAVFSIEFSITLLFYIYHKFIHTAKVRKHSFTVSLAEQATEGVTRIRMEREPRGSWKPGQFGFFTFLSDSVPTEEHPFTIANTDTHGSFVEINVKAIGDFTSKLPALKKDDRVSIAKPYGLFSYQLLRTKEYMVCIAGGIGITPIISMIRSLDQYMTFKKCLLIWSVKKSHELYLKEEIDNMITDHEWFHWIPVVNFEPEFPGHTEFLGPNNIKELVTKFIPTKAIITNASYFVCGPPALMKVVEDSLKGYGIPKEQIFMEQFRL